MHTPVCPPPGSAPIWAQGTGRVRPSVVGCPRCSRGARHSRGKAQPVPLPPLSGLCPVHRVPAAPLCLPQARASPHSPPLHHSRIEFPSFFVFCFPLLQYRRPDVASHVSRSIDLACNYMSPESGPTAASDGSQCVFLSPESGPAAASVVVVVVVGVVGVVIAVSVLFLRAFSSSRF